MIETERLILRRLLVSDHEAFCTLFADKEVMKFSDDGPLDTKAVDVWLKRQIDRYDIERGVGVLAVEIKSTAAVIGYCGLTQMSDIEGLPDSELGYRLIRPCWGYGYATEAASAIRDYAFSQPNVSRLVALIEPDNARSMGVAKKIGMHCEKPVMMEGYDHPDYLYVIDNPRQRVSLLPPRGVSH